MNNILYAVYFSPWLFFFIFHVYDRKIFLYCRVYLSLLLLSKWVLVDSFFFKSSLTHFSLSWAPETIENFCWRRWGSLLGNRSPRLASHCQSYYLQIKYYAEKVLSPHRSKLILLFLWLYQSEIPKKWLILTVQCVIRLINKCGCSTRALANGHL